MRIVLLLLLFAFIGLVSAMHTRDALDKSVEVSLDQLTDKAFHQASDKAISSQVATVAGAISTDAREGPLLYETMLLSAISLQDTRAAGISKASAGGELYSSYCRQL